MADRFLKNQMRRYDGTELEAVEHADGTFEPTGTIDENSMPIHSMRCVVSQTRGVIEHMYHVYSQLRIFKASGFVRRSMWGESFQNDDNVP